jgi:DNA (cytosine-5)-methyltransferase 1
MNESEFLVADPISANEARTYSNAGNNPRPRNCVVTPILEAGARTGKSTDDIRAGMGVGDPGDPMFTLQADKQHAVAFTQNSRSEVREIGGDGSIVGALASDAGAQQQNYVAAVALRGREGGATAELSELPSALRASQGGDYIASSAVRRLTPRECERLQGFPDDYTRIEYRNKPAADGPRYKALGNSMAVPVVRWILERIEKLDGGS